MNTETRIFPTLFKINKNGKRQEWSVSIDSNVVNRKYGQVGGKLISVDREYSGANIGKKNETSPRRTS